jgi:2-polyprenyl-6-methoxyphenol hydroxylase-like FAD-dependent oxidoreductase
VIHRVDAHTALLEGVKAQGQVALHTNTAVQTIEQDDKLVSVISIKDVTPKAEEVHDTQPDYQN